MYESSAPKQFNYLDLPKKTFVFNNYKTSNKYGTQIIKISDELWSALMKYFVHHKSLKVEKKEISIIEPTNFLVYQDGKHLDKVNSITRILNKIFGKAIGSSMLRHIFLTDKYGGVLEEASKDAKEMAHSSGMQKDYIKKPKPILVVL